MHTPPEPLPPHIPRSVFKPAQFLVALGSGLLGICPLLSLSSFSRHLFLAWSFWTLYPCLMKGLDHSGGPSASTGGLSVGCGLMSAEEAKLAGQDFLTEDCQGQAWEVLS